MLEIDQVEKDGFVNFQINSIKPQKPVEVQRESVENDWVKVIPVTKDDLKKLWDEVEAIKKRLDGLADYNKQLAQQIKDMGGVVNTEPHID